MAKVKKRENNWTHTKKQYYKNNKKTTNKKKNPEKHKTKKHLPHTKNHTKITIQQIKIKTTQQKYNKIKNYDTIIKQSIEQKNNLKQHKHK